MNNESLEEHHLLTTKAHYHKCYCNKIWTFLFLYIYIQCLEKTKNFLVKQGLAIFHVCYVFAVYCNVHECCVFAVHTVRCVILFCGIYYIINMHSGMNWPYLVLRVAFRTTLLLKVLFSMIVARLLLRRWVVHDMFLWKEILAR